MSSALLYSPSRFASNLHPFKKYITANRRRINVAVKATWSPSWDFFEQSNEDSGLHGVLHSAHLPSSLSESVGLYDARDAIEACSGLYGDDKTSCFAVFGVDSQADAYFDIVCKLETALELETGPEEEAFHNGSERC